MLDERISRRALLSGSALGAAALFADPAVLPARPPTASDSVRPYRAHVPEAAIADLGRRIRGTRWPDREIVPDRAQGARLADMQGDGAAPPGQAPPPGVTRADLQRHDLSAPGREVVQATITIAPGATAPDHSHPGEEIIYVLQGSFEYRVAGKPV